MSFDFHRISHYYSWTLRDTWLNHVAVFKEWYVTYESEDKYYISVNFRSRYKISAVENRNKQNDVA